MLQTRPFALLAVFAAFVSVPAYATLSVLPAGAPTQAAPAPGSAGGAPTQTAPQTQANAPQAGQPAGAPQDAQDIQKEIDQGNQQFKDTYNALNKMNPMAVHPTGGAPADPNDANGLVPSAISPEMQVQIDRVQALLSNPYVQKYLKVFTNSEVQSEFDALMNSPVKMNFIYFEIGWVVLILLLKIRLTMKSKNFLLIVFTQLWTSALFIVGSAYLVPRVVFGSLYLNLFNTVVALLKG